MVTPSRVNALYAAYARVEGLPTAFSRMANARRAALAAANADLDRQLRARETEARAATDALQEELAALLRQCQELGVAPTDTASSPSRPPGFAHVGGLLTRLRQVFDQRDDLNKTIGLIRRELAKMQDIVAAEQDSHRAQRRGRVRDQVIAIAGVLLALVPLLLGSSTPSLAACVAGSVILGLHVLRGPSLHVTKHLARHHSEHSPSGQPSSLRLRYAARLLGMYGGLTALIGLFTPVAEVLQMPAGVNGRGLLWGWLAVSVATLFYSANDL